jgi:hypothetical protein
VGLTALSTSPTDQARTVCPTLERN